MPDRKSWHSLWTTEELENYFGLDPSEVEQCRLERQNRKSTSQDVTRWLETTLPSQPVLHPGEVWGAVTLIELSQCENLSGDGEAGDEAMPVRSYQLILQVC